MSYNIHPIFVHFPIALLVLYSGIKLLPLKKWFPAVSWKHIERALLLVGILGAFVALSTGELAEELTRSSNRQLIEMHSLFATVATWLYGVLLFGEILSVLREWFIRKIPSLKLVAVVLFVERILTDKVLSGMFAVLGLIAITLTGLLGGVMVYGLSSDPFAGSILQMLGIQL